jgi:release factor glutamine methyltransferase
MQQQTPPQWHILSLLRWAESYFASHDVENPRASAEMLLAHALNLRRIDLYIRYDQPMIPDELSRFKTLIRRRADGEPVAYIVGQKEFWSLELRVTPDVLIPRPDTEILVEAAVAALPKDAGQTPLRVLELGTGSGAIISAIASERPEHYFFASDCSLKALDIARQNAQSHQLDAAICFFASDWFSALKPIPHFDLILSNPPYIPSADIDTLQPEIRKFEPRHALDGGKDGLDAIRDIIGHAKNYLNPGGSLMLEIGYDQRKQVSEMSVSGGYEQIRFVKDYGGHDRVIRMLAPA